MDWQWLAGLSRVNEKPDVGHAANGRPVILKVDDRKGMGVIMDSSPVPAIRTGTGAE